ncbi:class I SAM-dependent methyltransferase [Cohnella sp. GCM10012308]|uniref:class I SAM-dependent methyltransferase n=1 Tax=Cohnella sp. GCM10012308 TaxID=3317329 RepID=UPI0036085A29
MHSKSNPDHTSPATGAKSSEVMSRLGAEVLSLLQPAPGERILDLGCGNGDLTARIAAAGAIPTGIDLSAESVALARGRHPYLDIQAADASLYLTDTRYDAVFSHAALHWIGNAEATARTVWLALRDGGRFVAEFAGSGNLASLTDAIGQVLSARGYDPEGRNPWYLPTIGEYAGLLERTGFRVTFALHFDQPSPSKAPSGVRALLDSFAGCFFPDVPPAELASVYDEVEAAVKPRLYRDGQWIIDKSRLRIAAVKVSR